MYSICCAVCLGLSFVNFFHLGSVLVNIGPCSLFFAALFGMLAGMSLKLARVSGLLPQNLCTVCRIC